MDRGRQLLAGGHPAALELHLAEKRSCRSSAFSVLTPEQGGQLVDLVLARQVLREEVRRVDFPSDLSHRYRTSPVFLLYPQGVGLEMPQLPKTGPRRYPERGARVGPNTDRHDKAHVAEQALVAKASSRRFDQPVELCLTGGQSH